MVYHRNTVPFAILTHVPVTLDAFEPFLIDECVFHWTDRDAIQKIFDSGYLKAGRDAIYFAWNCAFVNRRPGHKQNSPHAPLKYKPGKNGYDKKREFGIGFHLKKLLADFPGLNLSQF